MNRIRKEIRSLEIMNNTKEERQVLFLFCFSEPVKILLRCDLVVVHAIVAFFRTHIHHKTMSPSEFRARETPECAVLKE